MNKSKSDSDSEKRSKRKLSSDSSSSSSNEDAEDVIYEISSESEPEIDCDHWDNHTNIINTKPIKSVIGYHLMPTCSRNPDENFNKKQKLSPEIRTDLLDSNFKATFQDSWINNKEFISGGTETVVDPFKVCIIDNFIENPNILRNVRQEFNEIDWNVRSLDLYEFYQSLDLKHLSNHEAIASIYKLLQNDAMKWIAELTGFNLTHISATCSLYTNTDYLLVHDDQREDRMVAFILYLSENDWNQGKGGALQLLNKDSEGHPSEITRNIYPKNNQFVFFPVSNDSYHQVGEVTSMSDCRMSINGWFHSEIAPVFETPIYQPHPQGLFSEKQNKAIDFDADLSAWLTGEYVETDIIKDVQEYFEENSEISLRHFLKDESFSEILKILEGESLKWVKIGPPNRYCYEVAETSDLPEVLDRFLKLFQSKLMFSLLQKYTGLELNQDSAYMKFELQKWTPGCYSLLGDYGWYEKKELDLVIHFGCKKNSDVIGARTLYVTTDEQIQDALITLEPEENCLNLVYRDTARFTKYFSKESRCRCFYTLICSYSE